ncbi:Fuc2NAc and GlcNAc transferase [Burkholderia multivorans]
MNSSMFLAGLLANALVAWGGAALVARNAARLGLVQMPNHRSSHVRPTPQGGGSGIVVAGVLSGWMLGAGQAAPWWGTVLVGVAVAAIGAWDDVRQISARLRFVAHIAAIGVLLWLQAPLVPVGVGAGLVLGGPALALLLLLAGVWWINLFNFMDGIDGLAGSQAVFMLAGACVLALCAHPASFATPAWWYMAWIAAACLGFLVVNWAPARIFMGDVGSTYLAFAMFALAMATVHAGWLNYPAWLILAALFVCDATMTLLQRMGTGQRWADAHRSHVYQRLSRRYASHARVTALYMAVNVVWLAPLAYCALAFSRFAWFAVIVAYVPLLCVAWRLRAGLPDKI